jgi:thioesterase domain-containing protein
MAASYICELRALEPEGPYFLGGHSGGTIVALEMAQQLRTLGQDVALLAFFEPTKFGALTRLRQYVKQLLNLGLGHYLRKYYKRIFWRLPIRLALRFGYSVPHTWRSDPMLISLIHAQAASLYKPQPYSGRIALFLSAESQRRNDPRLMEWENVATGDLEVHEVPGDHLTIFKEPYIQILAARLKSCLEQAQAKSNLR